MGNENSRTKKGRRPIPQLQLKMDESNHAHYSNSACSQKRIDNTRFVFNSSTFSLNNHNSNNMKRTPSPFPHQLTHSDSNRSTASYSARSSTTQSYHSTTFDFKEDAFTYVQSIDKIPQESMIDEDALLDNGRPKKNKRKRYRHKTKRKTVNTPRNTKNRSFSRSVSLPPVVLCNTRSNSKKPKKYKKRESIMGSSVHNGITGKYISDKIANCAAIFWIQNVDSLSRKDQLEIGCLQWFYLLETHPELQLQFFSKKREKIEETSLRFLDMFGWLIRSLRLENVNLWKVLTKIGDQHCKMKILPSHYRMLLDAFHYSFALSFNKDYTIEVKFCMDQIYTIAACIMTGNNYNQLSFGDRVLTLNDCAFIKNLKSCLGSEVGKEYLFRFLGQTYCSEIVIFLKSLIEYRNICKFESENEMKKMECAEYIASVSLSQSQSQFPINVSHCLILEFWSKFDECKMNDNNHFDECLFDDIANEIEKLILNNHWSEFVNTVKKMQKTQMSLENGSNNKKKNKSVKNINL